MASTPEFHEAIANKELASNEYTPLVDGTFLHFNIDLNLGDNVIDLEVLQRLLRQNGLELVKGEAEMMCIVIRDAKKLQRHLLN